jgi:hypothetical protein
VSLIAVQKYYNIAIACASCVSPDYNGLLHI